MNMKLHTLPILTSGIFSALLAVTASAASHIGDGVATATFEADPNPPATSVIANTGAGGLIINPTFTANFNANFGANAAAARAAWIAAANVFASNYSDTIHVNITVDAVAGTSVFGQSNTFLNSTSYANLRAKLVADAKSPDDATAIGAGGSMTVADPTAGAGIWWVCRAQAKAIGLIADDFSNDGTTTFGTGNPFSFSGPPPLGTYDFTGIAAHEISEVMGRLGLAGGSIGVNSPSYSLMDNFAYTGAGIKNLGNGGGRFFSFNGGTSLLKLYNNGAANGLDAVDWAPGTNDSFNQFSSSGVVNPVSAVDLQLLDVIGYDKATPAPEPSTLTLCALCFGMMGMARRRRASAPV